MNHVVRLINSMGISSFIQSLFYKISFFITRNDRCYAIMMDTAFCMSIMVVMVETWMRKANSYPKYVYIPLSTILCSFHMENTQSSRCYLVSGWSLQRTVSNQEFNADIYCGQALSSNVIQVSRAKRKFMQLSPYVASSLSLCSWVQWAITWVAGEKCWLTPTEHVILFAWLLWIFSAGKTLCGIHRKHKYLQSPCPFWKVYPHTSFSVYLATNRMLFLLRPGHPAKLFTALYKSLSIHTSRSPLTANKADHWMNLLTLHPIGEFSLITVLQGQPFVGLYYYNCPLSDGTSISRYPPVNQAQYFFSYSSVNWS